MGPNEEQLAFYHQIGMAITQWAHVEFALSDVVCAAFEDKETTALGVAFFSVENFRSKLRLTENVICARFRSTPHFGDWIALHARTKSASDARNKLAHYCVLVYPNDVPGRRMCLLPRMGNMRKTPSKWPQERPPGTLCVRDISQLVRRFSLLANALHNFAARIRGRPAVLPEQEPGPMSLRELRHMIHTLAGPLPRLSRK